MGDATPTKIIIREIKNCRCETRNQRKGILHYLVHVHRDSLIESFRSGPVTIAFIDQLLNA